MSFYKWWQRWWIKARRLWQVVSEGEGEEESSEKTVTMEVVKRKGSNNSSLCLRVAVEIFGPFLEFTRRPKPHNFHGVMLGVLAIIRDQLDVCMEFVVPPVSVFGKLLENGSWIGVLGMLHKREADMSGIPLSLTVDMLRAMDISVPLFMDRQTLMYRRPVLEPDLLGFVKPYTLEVWLWLAAAMVVVPVGLFFIDQHCKRFLIQRPHSPFASSSNSFSSLAISKVSAEQSSSSLGNTFQWVFGMVMGQSIELVLHGYSAVSASVMWVVMALILSVVYRSNLNAMLIAPKLRLPFDSMEELAMTNIPFMALEGSMMYNLYMNATPGSVLYRLRKQAVPSHSDIVRAIFDVAEGKYAGAGSTFAGDNSINLLYALTHSCPVYLARKAYISGSIVSLLYTKGFRLRHQIDNIITRLVESGILDYLYAQGVPNVTKCSRYASLSYTGDSGRALSLGDFYGVFCVYAGGIFMASLMLVLEVILKRRAPTP